jgi:hypothetical protein
MKMLWKIMYYFNQSRSSIPYGFPETNYFSSVDIIIIIAGPTSVSYREIDYDSFSSSALKEKNWEDLPGD